MDMDMHHIHTVLYRATQPSLGTIVLTGLLLTLTCMLLLLTIFLRQVPLYLPIPLRIYTTCNYTTATQQAAALHDTTCDSATVTQCDSATVTRCVTAREGHDR